MKTNNGKFVVYNVGDPIAGRWYYRPVEMARQHDNPYSQLFYHPADALEAAQEEEDRNEQSTTIISYDS